MKHDEFAKVSEYFRLASEQVREYIPLPISGKAVFALSRVYVFCSSFLYSLAASVPLRFISSGLFPGLS
jgi:hypothetical protein